MLLMLLLLMRIPVADAVPPPLPPVDWCTVLAMAVTVVVVVTTLFSWSILVTAVVVWSTFPGSSLKSMSLLLLLLLARRWLLLARGTDGAVAANAVANWEELVGSLSLKLPLRLFFGFRKITLGSITTSFRFASAH